MNTEQAEDAENPNQVAGDAIGNTAYSERFVLKILLKLANLETLEKEIKEKSFEDDLCTLWDMTTEKDVVLFLQKHEIFKLFTFSLTFMNVNFTANTRIIEIIIGIIANMCCHKEVDVLDVLMEMDELLGILVDYINTDDSLVLVQLLRLVSDCFSLGDDDDTEIWMNMFATYDYPSALYFILKNSSHREVIVMALENLNTLCSLCNTDKFRTKFHTLFVLQEALDSLTSAFTEIVKQKDTYPKKLFERELFLSLKIVLNLVGFENSCVLYADSRENLTTLINGILKYYEEKMIVNKEIHSEIIIHIVVSTNTIVNVLHITGPPDKYFEPVLNMWNATSCIIQTDNDGSSFEEDDKEELKDFVAKVRTPMAKLMCYYLVNITEDEFFTVFPVVETVYDEIFIWIKDQPLETSISKRVTEYRSRLQDDVDVDLK